MGQMDQGFKAWFDLCKADVVPFVTDDPQAQYLGDIPTEIAAEPQLLPDSLYRVRSQGIEHILNIEVQSYPDATMDRRLYEYGVRANLAYKLPVKSVVLWLFRQRGKRVPKPPYKIYIGNELETLWNFTNIELYTLPASAIIKATAVGLMPVVPFTQGAGQEIVEAAMRRVRGSTRAAGRATSGAAGPLYHPLSWRSIRPWSGQEILHVYRDFAGISALPLDDGRSRG